MPIKCRDILEHGCGEIGFLQCCTQGICVYLHGLMHLFLTGLGAGWNAMVRCCVLSVTCDSSSVGVNWGVSDFKLANWVLSCWNFSRKSAKGWQVTVSSQYSLAESLSPSGTGLSCGVRSKGDGSLVSWMSSVLWLSYLVTMSCILQCIPKLFSRDFRVLSVVSGHVHAVMVVQMIGGKSHLPGDGCDEHGCLLCRWWALWSGVGEIQLVTGEALDLFTSRYLWLSTVRSLAMAPV